MLYNTQVYWLLDSPLSAILKNIMFRKLDLFPSSGKRAGNTYSVGSVIKRYRSHKASDSGLLFLTDLRECLPFLHLSPLLPASYPMGTGGSFSG
jgi:hypothetical protein